MIRTLSVIRELAVSVGNFIYNKGKTTAPLILNFTTPSKGIVVSNDLSLFTVKVLKR